MKMRQKSINFMFIYILGIVSFSDASKDFPSPILIGCPFASDLIDFCTSEFNRCIDEKSGFQICSSQFYDCSKSNIPPSEQDCRDDITNTRRLLESRSDKYDMNYVPFEWMVELKEVFKELNNSCGLGIDKDKELSITDLVQMTSNNQCLQENQHKLDDALNKLSLVKSGNFEIPLDRFRCGWHFGDMGRVLSRYWIGEACGPYSVDVNHCCAIHLNCYMNQTGKEACDGQYSACRKDVASRMVSYKYNCAAIMSKSDHEIFVPSFEAYQSLGNIKMTTQISSFHGKHKTKLLDSTNFNFSQIKVFQLKGSPSLDHMIREKFNKEIYKNGWATRVIIDSCGMIFEDCSDHDKTSSCLNKLVHCLHDIQKRGDDFDVALRDFNQAVPTLPTPSLSKAEVEEMISASFYRDLIVFIILSILPWLLPMAWKHRAKLLICCGTPLTTPEPPEAVEMMDRGLVPIREGDNTEQ